MNRRSLARSRETCKPPFPCPCREAACDQGHERGRQFLPGWKGPSFPQARHRARRVARWTRPEPTAPMTGLPKLHAPARCIRAKAPASIRRHSTREQTIGMAPVACARTGCLRGIEPRDRAMPDNLRSVFVFRVVRLSTPGTPGSGESRRQRCGSFSRQRLRGLPQADPIAPVRGSGARWSTLLLYRRATSGICRAAERPRRPRTRSPRAGSGYPPRMQAGRGWGRGSR